jgi:hypothetical protein
MEKEKKNRNLQKTEKTSLMDYDESDYWTRSDVMRLCGISGSTFQLWVWGTGKTPPLPCMKVKSYRGSLGFRTLIHKEQFREWLSKYKSTRFSNTIRTLDHV